MKAAFLAICIGLLAPEVASHALFQYLWVNGVDQIRIFCALVSIMADTDDQARYNMCTSAIFKYTSYCRNV